ncbi:MAG: carbon-nitrogen hydrolase family protein [Pseudomonadota bacterium]
MAPSAPFLAACVQMRTGRDVAANFAAAETLIREAAGAGARFVSTPEMTLLMELDRDALVGKAVRGEDDPWVGRFALLARDLKIWLHVGSLAVELGDDAFANRGFLISDAGEVVATYDKIHMFDVAISQSEQYRESATYRAGDRAVVAASPWGGLGLSICYDLRFPALYQALVRGGADMIVVPAAFTAETGRAHWHTLLKARAIETGTFVLAAAQGGHHANGRRTYGHSLIVDPWGKILAEAADEPSFIMAEIDPSLVTSTRRRVPAWAGGPLFATYRTEA